MRLWIATIIFVLGVNLINASASDLETGFKNPPESAKPRTWWHWMSGNITKEGITADLEAMKKVGLGGATVLDIAGVPARGKIKSLSPEWFALVKHAIKEADRLGMELTIHNCPGWSSSGGPWIKPEQAMKELRYSETYVTGGKNIKMQLKQPPYGHNNKFYRDVAVLAFPSITGDGYDFKKSDPKLTTNLSPDMKLPNMPSYVKVTQDTADLLNGNWQRVVIFSPAKQKQAQYVLYEFPEPFTAGSVIMKMSGPPWNNEAKINILTSDDGTNFTPRVTDCTVTYPKAVASFTPVTAKFFKVEFTSVKNNGYLPLNELTFSPGVYIPEIGAKAVYKHYLKRYGYWPTPNIKISPDRIIKKKDIINISDKMDSKGELDWDSPEGKWTVIRFGYVARGTGNHPANPEARGLECDKLSKEGVDAIWSGMMKKIITDAGKLAGKSVTATLIDSYEVGPQNWTDSFPKEFNQLRGYDIIPYLPVFSGRYIESPDHSERFLQDLRLTISDLFGKYYGEYFSQVTHNDKLQLIIEPYGGPFDEIAQGKHADIPMGEFWSGSSGTPSSVRVAANVASINQRSIVQTESFTACPSAGRWQTCPAKHKRRGDYMFAEGINRFVFHTYAHQPWKSKNAIMTMGRWGFNFNRKNTLWNSYSGWISYISKSQFLLQQGQHVADALYVAAECVPSTIAFTPELPEGYSSNCISSKNIGTLSVENKQVKLANGLSYSLLIASNTEKASAKLLKELHNLAKNGACILLGKRPESCVGLDGIDESDRTFKQMVTELWGDFNGKGKNSKTIGKGIVFFGAQPKHVLEYLKLPPDLKITAKNKNRNLKYRHKKTKGADIYFLTNQSDAPSETEFKAEFRVGGLVPEIWNAETGELHAAPVYSQDNDKTAISMKLRNSESTFVIFRKKKKTPHLVKAQWNPAGQSASQGKLFITKAEWRGIDHKNKKDVTGLIRSKVKDDCLKLGVTNEALGGDIAPGTAKELEIEYTIAGTPGKTLAKEWGNINLVCPAEKYAANTANVLRKNGRIILCTAQSGTLQATSNTGNAVSVNIAQIPTPIDLSNNWDVSFPPDSGAPKKVKLPTLKSLSKNGNSGIKYFSGTSTYRKTFSLNSKQLKQDLALCLDLGKVMDIATVTVNGKEVGQLWHAPYSLDITSALKAGNNTLEIRVANRWVNRMIGDAQLPDDCEWVDHGYQLIKKYPEWFLKGEKSPSGRVVFSTFKYWPKNSKLLDSGLIGPVKLNFSVMKEIK